MEEGYTYEKIKEAIAFPKSNGTTANTRRRGLSPLGGDNRRIDDETLGVLMLAAQTAIITHVRGFTTALRKDILELFESILLKEFEGYGKMVNLAKSRRILKFPPVVSSLRI